MFSEEFEKRAGKDTLKHEMNVGEKEEAKEHHLGKKMSKKIAKDHLKEDKHYYKKIDRCLSKEASEGSNLVRGLEHAGLGILAAPSVAGLMKKKKPGATPEQEKEHKSEKRKNLAEVAGLGTLAAGVEAGHHGSFLNRSLKKVVGHV